MTGQYYQIEIIPKSYIINKQNSAKTQENHRVGKIKTRPIGGNNALKHATKRYEPANSIKSRIFMNTKVVQANAKEIET